MAFDPKRHLIKVQGGREYLPVSARLVWFRSEHPDWGIVTQPIEINLEKQYAIFQASIFNADGKLMATATKFVNVRNFADYITKAETGAVGRALLLCGYGAQFDPELDEGEVASNRYTPRSTSTYRDIPPPPRETSPRDLPLREAPRYPENRAPESRSPEPRPMEPPLGDLRSKSPERPSENRSPVRNDEQTMPPPRPLSERNGNNSTPRESDAPSPSHASAKYPEAERSASRPTGENRPTPPPQRAAGDSRSAGENRPLPNTPSERSALSAEPASSSPQTPRAQSAEPPAPVTRVPNRPTATPPSAAITRVKEAELPEPELDGDDEDEVDPFLDEMEPGTPDTVLRPNLPGKDRPLPNAQRPAPSANSQREVASAAQDAPPTGLNPRLGEGRPTMPRCSVEGCINSLSEPQMKMSLQKFGRAICLLHQKDQTITGGATGKRPARPGNDL